MLYTDGMQRVPLGYTIIEVIIFLAISTAILLTTIGFISGSEGHNRFSQSMRDTQSKIQDIINDIPTGVSGASVNVDAHCKFTAGLAQIDDGPAPNNGGPFNTSNCVFLGKAIQFTDKNWPDQAAPGKIYFYSVFGTRSTTTALGDIKEVSNLDEANVFAAVGNGGCNTCSGTKDFTEVYNIPGNSRVKSILNSSGVGGGGSFSHLAGFYLSFNQLFGTESGSANVRAYQYPLNGNRDPANVATASGQDAYDCLRLATINGVTCAPQAPVENWPRPLTDWQICFYNTNNTDQAVITISSQDGINVSTKLEFKEC
jgi:hypothetical protein